MKDTPCSSSDVRWLESPRDVNKLSTHAFSHLINSQSEAATRWGRTSSRPARMRAWNTPCCSTVYLQHSATSTLGCHWKHSEPWVRGSPLFCSQCSSWRTASLLTRPRTIEHTWLGASAHLLARQGPTLHATPTGTLILHALSSQSTSQHLNRRTYRWDVWLWSCSTDRGRIDKLLQEAWNPIFAKYPTGETKAEEYNVAFTVLPSLFESTISGFIPGYTHLQPWLNRVCWGCNYLTTRGAPSCIQVQTLQLVGFKDS